MFQSMLKKELAPKGLTVNDTYLIMGDTYTQFLTVINFPSLIPLAYLSPIATNPEIMMFKKHIPVDSSIIAKTLNKRINKINSEINKESDATIREQLIQDAENLNIYLREMVANKDRVFDTHVHLMIKADSLQNLRHKKTEIQNSLTAMGLKTIVLITEQENILKSVTGLFGKVDIDDRMGTPIPSLSLAGMYPYGFNTLKDDGDATLLGVDYSGGVVLFNQFQYHYSKRNARTNGNMIILGETGSGKSTSGKVIIRSHIRNKHQVVAIDPEGELKDMIINNNGTFIDIGTNKIINPLHITDDEGETDESIDSVQRNHQKILNNVSFVKSFIKYYSPQIEDDVLSQLGYSLIALYEKFGINKEKPISELKSEDFPIFSDLVNSIDEEIQSLDDTKNSLQIKLLEKLKLKLMPLTNEDQYYFNAHTNIPLDNRTIAFNIKSLFDQTDNLRNAVMFNILRFAWAMCLDKSKNTLFTIDEAHILLDRKNTLGVQYIAQMQRRARKYNTATLLMTQNPSDFADPVVLNYGKAIFDNASYYLIMRLKPQGAKDLSQLIDLNPNEIENIKQYEQGQALFVAGKRRSQISVEVTRKELISFGDGGGH